MNSLTVVITLLILALSKFVGRNIFVIVGNDYLHFTLNYFENVSYVNEFKHARATYLLS